MLLGKLDLDRLSVEGGLECPVQLIQFDFKVDLITIIFALNPIFIKDVALYTVASIGTYSVNYCHNLPERAHTRCLPHPMMILSQR